MRLAKLLLKIPHNWMTQLLHEHYDVSIRVFNCMPYELGGGKGFMKISTPGKLDAIVESIKSRESVLRTSFSRISDRAVIGKVVIDKCAACTALKQSDCFMVSSKSMREGWLEWTVTADNNSAVYDLIDLLERYSCTVRLTRISPSAGSSGLTTRQEEILQFAYSNGYYEYPRRIQLRELSHIFEVAPSTMSEILRAGQRRVFSEYFSVQPG